jgi:putative restriction endonuclease
MVDAARRVYRQSRPPSTDEYVRGLTAIEPRISDLQRHLLVKQYHAPNGTVTGKQLAALVGVKDWRQVNLRYGGLGRIFCEATGFRPSQRDGGGYRWWSVWSSGYPKAGSFFWEMLPQVAEALETLNWVESSELKLPEEVTSEEQFAEGATRRISVNSYERSREARSRCIEHHGTACAACALDLESIYGPVARGFVHVHHLKPLSEVGAGYKVDPIDHLRPVCPNCHAIIHLGGGRTRR